MDRRGIRRFPFHAVGSVRDLHVFVCVTGLAQPSYNILFCVVSQYRLFGIRENATSSPPVKSPEPPRRGPAVPFVDAPEVGNMPLWQHLLHLPNDGFVPVRGAHDPCFQEAAPTKRLVAGDVVPRRVASSPISLDQLLQDRVFHA